MLRQIFSPRPEKQKLVGLGKREFVADVGAANPEDDVFRDVGGVVGGALQVARDDDGVEGLGADHRM